MSAPEHIVFVTGRLARARLEKVAAGLPKKFRWSIADAGVKVAELGVARGHRGDGQLGGHDVLRALPRDEHLLEYALRDGSADGALLDERDGHLALRTAGGTEYRLAGAGPNAFAFAGGGPSGATGLTVVRGVGGRVGALLLEGGPKSVALARRAVGPAEGGNQLQVTPVRPLDDLRREALAASPPREAGPFLPSDLVELTTLDSTVHLEVRYATTHNFLGTRFYDAPRAFLQRPAAGALVRANRALRPLGYGLLVHDAYRPWYVTKMFWDATPASVHWAVADPAEGSRHNRGAAVDLTLYDLATGRPVEMVSTYDETTPRAYADYPGGTSRQRWHRALLRRVMEAEGFRVNPQEWWHFDYRDWRRYPIGNVPFDRIAPATPPARAP